MKELFLSDVIKRTNSILQSCNYKSTVLKRFDIEFKIIDSYFSSLGQIYFCEDILRGYLEDKRLDFRKGSISLTTYHRKRRAVDKLIQCFERDSLLWRRMPNIDQDECNMYDDTSGILKDYNSYLVEKEHSSNTKKSYLHVSKLFMIYVSGRGHQTIKDITREDVVGFFPHISKRFNLASMSVVLTTLRSFFEFAQNRGLTGWNMSSALPRTSAVKTIVYEILTEEEEITLLQSIDRSTPTGKRDFALILLILRTGLRTVDVMNLKITDLDWRRNWITLIQQKTKRSLVLPLLPEVGNALMDYLLRGRPDSEDPHVFLRSQSPYIGFQHSYSCSEIIKRQLKQTGLDQHHPHGAHALRHSLASRLLQAETPVTVISSILGHSNKNSTKVYLATHFEALRTCALNLEGIELTRGVLS